MIADDQVELLPPELPPLSPPPDEPDEDDGADEFDEVLVELSLLVLLLSELLEAEVSDPLAPGFVLEYKSEYQPPPFK